MALSRFLDRILLVVFPSHYLVQMDFVVQEVIELEALKRLEHFLYRLLQVFNQGFVVNLKHQLCNKNILLLNPLLFFLNQLDEDLRLVIFLLDFSIPEINNLAQLIHAV